MNGSYLKVLGGIFTLLVLIKLFNISYPINIRIVNSTESAEFTVVGTGKVDVVPDVAVIDAGITVNNLSSADEVKKEMTLVNNRIIQSVKSSGVEKEDIETTGFNIYPEYSSDGIGRPIPLIQSSDSVSSSPSSDQSKISGYSGTASVTVKVRKKELASKVVNSVTGAGATNVSGPRFEVDKPEAYREKARSEAIKNAKEQAEKLSKELGIRLGKVTNMIESGNGPYYDYGRAGMEAMSSKVMSEPPVFEEGTDTVSSTVTLFFERK
jgi:uncharacterized protein